MDKRKECCLSPSYWALIGLKAEDNPLYHLPESLFYQWSLSHYLDNLLRAEPALLTCCRAT